MVVGTDNNVTHVTSSSWGRCDPAYRRKHGHEVRNIQDGDAGGNSGGVCRWSPASEAGDAGAENRTSVPSGPVQPVRNDGRGDDGPRFLNNGGNGRYPRVDGQP